MYITTKNDMTNIIKSEMVMIDHFQRKYIEKNILKENEIKKTKNIERFNTKKEEKQK